MISNQNFTDAYKDGFPVTVKFLMCRGAGPDEAEETAQAAWARGWEARGQLQNESRVLQWVNSIAYHKFCSEKRRSMLHLKLKEVADTSLSPAVYSDRIDARSLMSKCSRLNRSLLVHRFFGFSTEEIAKQHGLTPIATRVRIHRSRKALIDISSHVATNGKSACIPIDRGAASLARRRQANPPIPITTAKERRVQAERSVCLPPAV
jgi:DNA-directed RNA polymerase specialized sigma24 family protein